MADNSLFQGLPPPSAPLPSNSPPQEKQFKYSNDTNACNSEPNPPPPVLKSALKRTKPPEESQPQAIVPEKSLRFKTTDASEVQVIKAMEKIASHIKNLSKVGKASKLAIQLIQAGSVKPGTSNHFFSILESAMSSPTVCNDPSVRADYHALFLASQDAVEDPNHIIELEPDEIAENLTYEEVPIKILDRKEQILRSKVIPQDKALWRNHDIEEMTWELESEMKTKYPYLFELSRTLNFEDEIS